jgi:hypothetical protein
LATTGDFLALLRPQSFRALVENFLPLKRGLEFRLDKTNSAIPSTNKTREELIPKDNSELLGPVVAKALTTLPTPGLMLVNVPEPETTNGVTRDSVDPSSPVAVKVIVWVPAESPEGRFAVLPNVPRLLMIPVFRLTGVERITNEYVESGFNPWPSINIGEPPTTSPALAWRSR